MTNEELAQLRTDFVRANNERLKSLYQQYQEDCIKILISKAYCDKTTAIDHYTDAFIIFRNNLISKKITELTNVKGYLASTCMNLARSTYQAEQKKLKKEEQVRLLLYGDEHYKVDEGEKEEMLTDCLSALKTLTQRCQEILVAFYVHQLSMKEIAEDMQLSSSDVAKTLKSRCYQVWIKASKLRTKT